MPQNLKRQQIIEVAGELLTERGYHGTSMDAIAAAVPVSKPTLYNHFNDKKALFAAIVENRCKGLFNAMLHATSKSRNVPVVLTTVAERFMSLVFAPASVRLQQVLIAESKDFPELGELFYREGPQRAQNILAAYLRDLHTHKILYVPKPDRSAGMFLSMLKGYTHLECLLGLKKQLNSKERNVIIAYTVEMFIKAHTK